MNLSETKKEIAELSGISLDQNESLIERKILIALSRIDAIVDWNIAIKDFSKTIAAGKNYALVSDDFIFKPVVCVISISDNSYDLDFLQLTDFKRQTANITSTVSTPRKYSVGGNRLYVGPGLLAAEATITGSYRRRLTLNDVEYIPADLIINKALMSLHTPGTPEHIAAWSGWKEASKDIAKVYKVTAEKRSKKPLDKQLEANASYLNSL